MAYDKSNPFYQIINKKIDAKVVFENENTIAFWSIEPKAKVHILVIPKKEYVNFEDFSTRADSNEIGLFFQNVQHVAKDIMHLNDGYRIVINNGKNSNQTVHHLHVHILGGEFLDDGL